MINGKGGRKTKGRLEGEEGGKIPAFYGAFCAGSSLPPSTSTLFWTLCVLYSTVAASQSIIVKGGDGALMQFFKASQTNKRRDMA